MKRIVMGIAAMAALAASAAASAPTNLEGRWANAKRSVIVEVTRCGDAYCGVIDWASPKNRRKGVTPGTRVLSDLRPSGNGVYKGRALEPKRDIGASATVRQVGADTMVVKGCAVMGLICKEQRWTRLAR